MRPRQRARRAGANAWKAATQRPARGDREEVLEVMQQHELFMYDAILDQALDAFAQRDRRYGGGKVS